MRLNVCLGAALMLLPAAAFAQSTYGTIYGTITDSSSGVVRDALVEAKNPGSGVVRSTKTGADGSYRFVNLDPGTYTVSVTAPGFSAAEQRDVVLQAREERALPIQLQVAGAAASVEVNAAIEVSDQLTLSDSKSGDMLNSVPLNFRATNNPSPIIAAALAPGANVDSGGNITISGQLPTATSFSLDGISTQLPRFGGPSRDLFPSVKASPNSR